MVLELLEVLLTTVLVFMGGVKLGEWAVDWLPIPKRSSILGRKNVR